MPRPYQINNSHSGHNRQPSESHNGPKGEVTQSLGFSPAFPLDGRDARDWLGDEYAHPSSSKSIYPAIMVNLVGSPGHSSPNRDPGRKLVPPARPSQSRHKVYRWTIRSPLETCWSGHHVLRTGNKASSSLHLVFDELSTWTRVAPCRSVRPSLSS